MLKAPANFSYQNTLEGSEFLVDPRVIYAMPITHMQACELLEQKAFSQVNDSGVQLQRFVSESSGRGLAPGGPLESEAAAGAGRAETSSSSVFAEVSALYQDMIAYLEAMYARTHPAEAQGEGAGAQDPRALGGGGWGQESLAAIPPGVMEITSIVNARLALAPGEKPKAFMDRYFPDFLGSAISSAEERTRFCNKLGEFLSKLGRLRAGIR